jgi:hypothetical protein
LHSKNPCIQKSVRAAVLPLKEDQLGAEGWSHCGEDAVGSGLAGMNGEVVFEDRKDGCGGEVADLAEALPGRSEGIGWKREGLLHRFEDFGTAGVEDVGGDVCAGEAIVGEESIYVAEEVLFDDFGDVRGEDNFEAGIDDVPSHDALGVAVEGGACVKDAGAVIAAVEIGFGSGDDYGRGSVGEEPGGDEIGDGLVVVLPGERAEFDGEQKGDLFGEGADVIGSAGDSGGSGDTAETEDGGALDVDRKGKTVNEAGVDGRAGDSGNGGEEDGGDVLRTYSSTIEGPADSLLAEIDCMGYPGVVGLLEGVESGVVLKREDDVAELDATVGMETGEQAGLFHFVGPAVA